MLFFHESVKLLQSLKILCGYNKVVYDYRAHDYSKIIAKH